VAAAAVRLLGSTLRLTVQGTEPLMPAWAEGRPLIYAVWHGRILMVPWLNAHLRRRFRARPIRALASRSRDGELIARFAGRFGIDAVRGSSSRGGADALRALVGALRGEADVAVVPDGPRGPRERAQMGVVALAALTGAPIVPFAFAACPSRRLGTWDRFLLPAPFARAAAVFGSPLAIPRAGARAEALASVEQALTAVTEAADRLVRR
jgi:lysophospholipid acyltransferase (LPLAT)-like uncharacterized protein